VICPECTYPMAFVKNHTPINASGWKVERFRCDRCKLSAIVETTFEADEPEVTAPSIEKAQIHR